MRVPATIIGRCNKPHEVAPPARLPTWQPWVLVAASPMKRCGRAIDLYGDSRGGDGGG
jgi:hypothetical protein